MHMRWTNFAALLLLGSGAWWATANVGEQQPAAIKKAADLFGLDKCWTMHVKLTAEAWKDMQPKGGGMGFGKGPPGGKDGPKDGPKGGPPGGPGGGAPGKFGLEFTYVKGTLEFEKETIEDVGVRFKGNSSYMMSQGSLKHPFKIDFNRFVDDQKWHGLTMISLGNNAADPSQLREALAYHVFHEAGVPASRTAFVKLYLTVAGKYDREYVGLYTMIEAVNKQFLKDRFQTNKGMLLKPEGVSGLAYLGDEWKAYEDRYRPKSPPTDPQRQRLIDFVKLVQKADDETFKKKIDEFLDVDEFLRFLAGHVITSSLDSFLSMGHNYFMYLHPVSNKFLFLPWDENMAFAGFPMAGSPDQQLDLSIEKPFSGKNRLIERLLAMPTYDQKYHQVLKQLTETGFSKANMYAAIDLANKTIKEAVEDEAKAAAKRQEGGGGAFGKKGGFGGMKVPDLKPFVDKRIESVLAQLEGKSKGFEPSKGGFGGFGPGGPGGGMRFGLGQMLAPALFKEMDASGDKKVSPEEMQAWVKKIFQDNDKDSKGLDEKALATVVGKWLPEMPKFGGGGKGPPGGGGGKGPPGGGKGPPGGFDFGAMLARQLMKAIDPKVESDGKITQEKAAAAFEKFFKDWDKDKNGTLDESELGAGLDQILPPPGMGPGGPGGPGFPKEAPNEGRTGEAGR